MRRLITDVEVPLEVLDECPVALDQFNELKVAQARRVLDEAGIPAVQR